MEKESLLPQMRTQSVFFTFAALTLSIVGLIYFGSIFTAIPEDKFYFTFKLVV